VLRRRRERALKSQHLLIRRFLSRHQNHSAQLSQKHQPRQDTHQCLLRLQHLLAQIHNRRLRLKLRRPRLTLQWLPSLQHRLVRCRNQQPRLLVLRHIHPSRLRLQLHSVPCLRRRPPQEHPYPHPIRRCQLQLLTHSKLPRWQNQNQNRILLHPTHLCRLKLRPPSVHHNPSHLRQVVSQHNLRRLHSCHRKQKFRRRGKYHREAILPWQRRLRPHLLRRKL